MRMSAIKILTAFFALCVISSAATAGSSKNSKNKVRQEAKADKGSSRAKTPAKIKACEAGPQTYWDYFSNRCLTIGK